MNSAYVFIGICLWLLLSVWACNFPKLNRDLEEAKISLEKTRRELENNRD